MSDGKMITLTGGDGFSFGAWHQSPKGPRKGGLVLVMEIFGVTQHIRDLCAEFAGHGYEILSPQLYDRGQKDFQAGYTSDDIAKGLALRAATPYDAVVSDVQACIDFLANRGKVGILGFCYGGSVSFLAAGRCRGLAAASGYYGSAIKDMLDLVPKCPTILHFGEKDHGIPMEIVETIASAQPGVNCFIYPADHGFVSDRPSNHDAAATALAHRRTLRLFEQYVDQPPKA
jgi:carboxymethylenebutenolidase